MKKFIVWFVSLGLTLAAQAAGTFQEFTEADGRVTQSMVLSLDISDDKVEILRADGSLDCIETAAFSEADKTYLEQWKACALFLSPAHFSIIPRRTLVQSWRCGGGTADRVTRYAYDLGMINRTGLAMDNLTIEYMAWYQPQEGPAEGEVEIVRGTIPIDCLEAGGYRTFSLDGYALMERDVRENAETGEAEQSRMCIRVMMKAPDGSQLERIYSLPYSNTLSQTARISRTEMQIENESADA